MLTGATWRGKYLQRLEVRGQGSAVWTSTNRNRATLFVAVLRKMKRITSTFNLRLHLFPAFRLVVALWQVQRGRKSAKTDLVTGLVGCCSWSNLNPLRVRPGGNEGSWNFSPQCCDCNSFSIIQLFFLFSFFPQTDKSDIAYNKQH